MFEVNPQLFQMAQHVTRGGSVKTAFVPAQAGGGGDPSGGAGGPPPDPSQMGGDPSGGAGAGAGGPPPMAASPFPPPGGDPSGGGGGGMDPGAIAQQVIQMLQAQGIGGGQGGQGGGMEPIKPKIDVNVAIVQILKILAKFADRLGIPIPASDMIATQGDLTSFGMAQQSGQDMPASAPQQSAIPPIGPMPGAGPGMGKTSSDRKPMYNDGEPFDASMVRLSNMASAGSQLLRAMKLPPRQN